MLNFDGFSAGQFEPLSLERRGFASGLRMASMPMGTVSEKLKIKVKIFYENLTKMKSNKESNGPIDYKKRSYSTRSRLLDLLEQ